MAGQLINRAMTMKALLGNDHLEHNLPFCSWAFWRGRWQVALNKFHHAELWFFEDAAEAQEAILRHLRWCARQPYNIPGAPGRNTMRMSIKGRRLAWMDRSIPFAEYRVCLVSIHNLIPRYERCHTRKFTLPKQRPCL